MIIILLFFEKNQKKRLRVTKLVVLLQPHSGTNDVEWCNGSTADFGCLSRFESLLDNLRWKKRPATLSNRFFYLKLEF